MAKNTAARSVIIRGIPMEIKRKAVKALRITVHSDCRVSLTVPITATAETLAAFIDSKFPWLEKHLARYQEQARKKPLAHNIFSSGEIHYVWGIPHILKVIERRGNPAIVLGGGKPSPWGASEGCAPPPSPGGSAPKPPPRTMEMYLRPGGAAARKQALLDKWRKSLVAKAAPPLAAKWEKPLEAASGKKGFAVEKIYLQKMKTHWGSCNPSRRTIRLNTELSAKPPECLDYVILHEMVHFITPFHNQVFYSYMNKLMPGWKEIRKKMNRGEL